MSRHRGRSTQTRRTASCLKPIQQVGPPTHARSTDRQKCATSCMIAAIRLAGTEIVGQWDIALRDLDYAVGLDSDNDGTITWRELRAHHAVVADYMLSHLALQSDGKICPARAIDQLVDEHG